MLTSSIILSNVSTLYELTFQLFQPRQTGPHMIREGEEGGGGRGGKTQFCYILVLI